MISVRNSGRGAKPNTESKRGYIWWRSGVWPFKWLDYHYRKVQLKRDVLYKAWPDKDFV